MPARASAARFALAAGLLWRVSLVSADAQSVAPHETAAVACVESYCRAVAAGDVSDALKRCTEKRDLRDALVSLTSELADKLNRVSADIRTFYRAGDETRAVVRVRVNWSDGNGKQVLGLDFRLDREGDAWLIQGSRDAYDHVQKTLAEADAADRAGIIEQNGELVDAALALQMRRDAERLSIAGSYDEAVRMADAAIAVGERLKSPYDLGYAYLTRGSIRKRKSEWNPALNDYESARKQFVEAKDREGEGKTQSRAASIYQRVGLLEKAVRFNQNALDIAREIKDEDAEANALQDIGAVLKDMGRPAEALTYNTQARAIRQQRGEKARDAVLMANEAGLHADLGRYGKAVGMFLEALTLLRELKDTNGAAFALNNLGNLLDEMGDLEGARDRLSEARDAFRETRDRPGEYMALHNLAGVLARLGDTDAALEAGMMAATIADEIDERRYQAQSDGLLQEILLKLKRYEQALELTEERLEAARTTHNLVQEAAALTAAASALILLNRPEDARVRLDQALPAAEKTGSLATLRQIWRGYGDVAAARRDWDGAARAYGEAMRCIEQDRLAAQEQSLRTGYLRQHIPVYRSLIMALVASGRHVEAFTVSEQAKGRALADLLAGGKVDLNKGMTEEDRRRASELQSEIRTLMARLENAVSTDEIDAVRTEIERARKAYEEFRVALYLRQPDLETRRAEFSPASLKEIGETLLDRSTAILSYTFTPDRCYLFVIHRAKDGKVRLECIATSLQASALRTESEALWRSAAAPGGAYERPARALYRMLIAPAAPLLAAKTHLIIVPDPAAPTIPYAVMLDAKGQPVISRWSVSYAPSVTALLRMVRAAHHAAAKGPGILAVGSPRFPKGFSPLPATAEEARRIARLKPGSRVLTGSSATRSHVLASAASARYVHLATHGVLDERAPMQSAIVLTPEGEDDGLVRARDLADSALRADMVVLSACETALGRHISGEGVLGLTWALFAAGATSTVATQWQVYDESTRTLMVEFYRRLLKPAGKAVSKAEALRQAQLAVRSMPQYRHPYYWGAFMLSGNWLP